MAEYTGYTDGVAKMLSEQSLTMGLFYDGFKFDSGKPQKPQIMNFLNDYLDDNETTRAANALMETGQYDRDDGYSVFISDNGAGDSQLEYQLDEIETLSQLCEGGLQALVEDTDPSDDSEIIGWLLGVAGEHLGSVSVWLDTFNGVLRQGGQSYRVSDVDTIELNNTLTECYGDTIGESGDAGQSFGVVPISELKY